MQGKNVDTVDEKKARIQERKKAGKEVLWKSNPWVYIRRQWNDYRVGKVRLQSLQNLYWDDISGGVFSRAPQPFIHGYVYCNEVDGDIAHSCLHGKGPHYIKVCVVKKDNDKKVFELLNDVVGPKPGQNKSGKADSGVY